MPQVAFLILYAEILITTKQQRPTNAEPKTDAKTTPDSLMMSVGATPLSNYLKNKVIKI